MMLISCSHGPVFLTAPWSSVWGFRMRGCRLVHRFQGGQCMRRDHGWLTPVARISLRGWWGYPGWSACDCCPTTVWGLFHGSYFDRCKNQPSKKNNPGNRHKSPLQALQAPGPGTIELWGSSQASSSYLVLIRRTPLHPRTNHWRISLRPVDPYAFPLRSATRQKS
jgi:hypothetical protein